MHEHEYPTINGFAYSQPDSWTVRPCLQRSVGVLHGAYDARRSSLASGSPSRGNLEADAESGDPRPYPKVAADAVAVISTTSTSTT